MRVKILKLGSANSGVWVSFLCCCGVGTGKWMGELPKVGEEREVEFDTDEELQLGRNATPATSQQAAIAKSVDGVVVTAQLVALHEDVRTGRFAFDDGRIEVEATDPDLSSWKVGNWYTLRLGALVVFDADV